MTDTPDDDAVPDSEATSEEATATEEEPDAPERASRLGGWTWLVLAASMVAAAAAYWAWQEADEDPERARASLRDHAMIDGRAAVETMNSMDYRDVEGGLDAWRSVTTGVLHDQLAAIGEEDGELLAEQGKIATGQVIEAALTDLTEDTATMIVAMEVTVATGDTETTEEEEPTVKRNRFTADLVLVDGDWRIENLGQVPVTLQ